MSEASALLLARAELYLCLGRAFAQPDSMQVFEALRDELPHDLRSLGDQCAYPVGDAVDRLAASLADTEPQALLATYARLFLIPGEQHPSLNAGAYLDGCLAGGSVSAIETCYLRCGLARQPGFADLPDHVTVQLEFVAWLLAAEAGAALGERAPPPMRADEFLSSFVARWATPLRAEIGLASARFKRPSHPYLALAEILECVVGQDVCLEPQEAGDRGIDPEIARLRAQFAGRRMSGEDIEVIRARLAADGLSSEHVAIPVDERDRVMGLAAMRPPELPGRRPIFGNCGGA